MPVKKLSCHKPQDSLLTSSSGYTNYRGVLNLCIILLVLSNARVALENVIKYGILVDLMSILRSLHNPTILPSVQILTSLGVFIGISYLIERFISHPSSKLRSFLSTNKVEKVAMSLVVLNTSILVILPAYLVYTRDCHAVFSSISLSFTSVIFLKLISYHMTNYWYRNLPKNASIQQQQQQQLTPSTTATIKSNNNCTTANSPNSKCNLLAKDNNNVNKNNTLTADMDVVASSICNNKSTHGESGDDLVKQTTQEQTSQTDKVNTNDEMNVTRRKVSKDNQSDKSETKITQSTMSTVSPSSKLQPAPTTVSTGKTSNLVKGKNEQPTPINDEDTLESSKENFLVVYPNNITIKDIAYFISVPTLCYEANFPRTSRIRKRFIIKRAVECIFLSQLMLGLVQQWLIPTISNSIGPLKQMDYAKMAERLLKLAIPNHIIWLIGFYWFFHSCFNFWAEVMRFADREFYRDWWNSCSVQYFWANWNIPVHKWCLRHLYIPLLDLGCTKSQASVMVFLVSAFFHEYLVSVPLKMFRVWAFSGMLFQVPFAYFVSTFEHHPQWANTAVWVSLILGQPLCILMYYHDYYIANFIN